MSKELLVFSAKWCQSCQSLKKMLQSNGISYTEIDIDVNPEMAQEYGVRSLPTSIIVDKDAPGIKCDMFIGVKLQEIIKGMQ